MAASRRLPAIALLAAAALPVGAQVDDDPFTSEEFQFEGVRAATEIPQLTFELLSETPLPGPLPGDGPRWVEGRVVVRTAEGDRVTAVEVGSAGDAVAGGPFPVADDDWIVAADGRMRFRSRGSRIVAQKRCPRCRHGWKRVWRARVAGSELAPPLPLADRVCFGALDNLVYCLNPRNGHRLWMTDVEGRITRPLVHWIGELPPAETHDSSEPPQEISIVLAVLDGGSRLLALSATEGRRLASVSLGEDEGAFVAVPLAASDGRVVVARQWYRKDKASLMVYRLTLPAPSPVETDAPAEPEDQPDDSG